MISTSCADVCLIFIEKFCNEGSHGALRWGCGLTQSSESVGGEDGECDEIRVKGTLD